MDKLYMVTGPLMGATSELIEEKATIRRTPDNIICIADESVSHQQATWPQSTAQAGSSFKSKLVTFVALMLLASGYAAPQSVAQDVDLGQLKPEDWVAGLSAQAQQSYLTTQASQRGPTRIEALRHWLSLWTRLMRDPNLTLVELDYVKYVIQYRDPLIDKALQEARHRWTRIVRIEWGSIQEAMSRKVSDLTSMENKLASMRVRSGKQTKLATLIGEQVDRAAKERAELAEIVDYYQYLCRMHHWYYDWFRFWHP